MVELKAAFPNQRIDRRGDYFVVTLKNGVVVRVKTVPVITADAMALELGYGKQALDDGKQIAGSYQRDTSGVEDSGRIELIKSPNGVYNLSHESIHFLEGFGIISRADGIILNKRIRRDGKWKSGLSASENRAYYLADELNAPAPTTAAGKVWAKIKEFIDKIRNLIGDRTAEGIAREIKSGEIFGKEADMSRNEDGVAFSVNDQEVSDFAKQLDGYKNGTLDARTPLTIGETPYVLERLGAEQLPLVISQATVRKITADKHGLSIETLKQLPAHLTNPIMVFDSATQVDSLVVMTELKQDGKTTIAAIHLSKEMGNNVVNDVASVYGKDSDGIFIKWINDGLLRYMNKNKSRAWSLASGLQLPRVSGSELGSGKKILFDYDLVKGKVQYVSRANRIVRFCSK